MNDTSGAPIPDGLFCEKIFGPIKDWKCYCKKIDNIRKKAFRRNSVNICGKCEVQITESKIRNYRMG